MHVRTLIAAALTLSTIALNPYGEAVLAANIAPQAAAQVVASNGAPSFDPNSIIAQDRAYTDTQVAALNTTLNSAPSITTFATAMASAGLLTTPAQAANLAPVQSVNTLTGAVTVPGSIRASCAISTFNGSGVGTCSYSGFTGGTAFTSTPDCFAELTATNISYVYAFPIVQRAQTGVTVTMSAALKVLNIALGATTIWGPPPSGTTLTVICRGQ